ncbi:MAG: tetratricopeptide repeat protein [Tepidisphaeraceae bacterium]|jgi:Flp pilus assembly protein TadD
MPAPSDRLQKLQQLLEKSPADAFLLYAIAMEHRNAGQPDSALEFFQRVVQADPTYCYAYHQKGLLLESMGKLADAREAYRQGIQAAEKKPDLHAREEIAAALSMIEP